MIIGASDKIIAKLAGRKIVVRDCWEAMKNKHGRALEDTRGNNKTTTPTFWIIGDTDAGRILKVVFVYNHRDRSYSIKTAYEPNEIEIHYYNKHAIWKK